MLGSVSDAEDILQDVWIRWQAYDRSTVQNAQAFLATTTTRMAIKWGAPRAKLLDGDAWEQARPTVLASLSLPGERGGHLAARAALLDGNGTGRTSCGSSAPSTPAPSAPTTSSACSPGTAAPRRSGTRSRTTGGSRRPCTSCAWPTSPATGGRSRCRNLQEGCHALARKIFHGRSGQLYQRYQDGMEDQIGALDLVPNALVLFNTRYMDAAVNQLRADGFDVRDQDVARLSPFVRHHINMLGRYSFRLPELPGGLRPLRDKDNADGS
jgi:hypothetical protein